jgi:hypothetical protein
LWCRAPLGVAPELLGERSRTRTPPVPKHELGGAVAVIARTGFFRPLFRFQGAASREGEA